jgi:hypothetical protein
MSGLKTRPTDQKPNDFLETVEHSTRKSDGYRLLEIFKEVTGDKPVMWGSSIVGFGVFKYANTRGKEFEWPRVGFSPRKQSLSIYITPGFDGFQDLLEELGKHRLGKGCLYINKLLDVDIEVLKKIIYRAYIETKSNA